MLPKISIITPTLNSEKYLTDAIESVRDQNYDNYEHLIIDGGSNDSTLDIVRRYPHLQCVSESDQGQSEAINKGFRRATGDLIVWLNSDDYFLQGAFQIIADEFQNQPTVDLFYGERIIVNDVRKTLKIQRDHRFDLGVLLYDYCYISSTATFIRRRVLDQGYYLDESYKVTMDLEFYVRLATRGYTFAHIPKQLAAFRLHGSNVSETFFDRRREERISVQLNYGRVLFKNRRLQEVFFDSLRPVFKTKRLILKFLGR